MGNKVFRAELKEPRLSNSLEVDSAPSPQQILIKGHI